MKGRFNDRLRVKESKRMIGEKRRVIFDHFSPLLVRQKKTGGQPMNKQTDQWTHERTYGLTYGRTDISSYRDARTHIKTRLTGKNAETRADIEEMRTISSRWTCR